MSHIAKIALLVAVLTTFSLGAAPGDAFGKSCNISGKEKKLGPTYVSRVDTKGAKCSGAIKLVKDFHKCRYNAGGRSARCPRRVSGYRCTESRISSKVQYDSRVTCKKGKRRVSHVYTQNT